MLRAVYGNDTLHLPASLLGTFLLLDCAVSAGLDLNGKSRASCLSSGAHLTSHRVSTGTARAASMAVDQCHSGTAETAPCWNPSEPWDLHRAGAVVGSTGIVFLHRRKALLPCWTLMYSRIAGEWFLRHFNEKAGGKEPPSCCGSILGESELCNSAPTCHELTPCPKWSHSEVPASSCPLLSLETIYSTGCRDNVSCIITLSSSCSVTLTTKKTALWSVRRNFAEEKHRF